MFVEVSSTY